MYSNIHSDLIPGVFVINEKQSEWGVGQIQSSVDNMITINFEHVGKKVVNVNAKEINLKTIKI